MKAMRRVRSSARRNDIEVGGTKPKACLTLLPRLQHWLSLDLKSGQGCTNPGSYNDVETRQLQVEDLLLE